MLRVLQENGAKNVPIRTAGEDMTRGAVVAVDRGDGTLVKANGALGLSFVDVAPNSDGINSMITPTDDKFEEISQGQLVLQCLTYPGESFSTTEVDPTNLDIGGLLKAVDGKLVKADGGTMCDMAFGGPCADPTGLKMYTVTKLATPEQA